MSAISTRYPTTSSRSSTYLPTTSIDSYRRSTYSTYSSGTRSSFASDPTYRRSILLDRYDTPTASSRFGVSRLSSAIQTTSIPSSRIIPRHVNYERDSSKPPIGSRFRSDSRLRELSLDRNGYTSSIDTKHLLDSVTKPSTNNTTTTSSSSSSSSPQTLSNTTKRSSSTSLARSLATSGADLYEKYSVANYKPNCELSRSRSLTDSKLDSLNTSHTAVRRSTSKDRGTPTALGGSLLAASGSCATAKDYLTPSIGSIAQVKTTNTNELLSVCAINLANSRCFSSVNSSSPTHLITNSIDNSNNNNYKTNNNNNIHIITTTTNTVTTTTSTTTTTTTTTTNNNNDNANNRKHPILINDSSNNNIHLKSLSAAICVSAASNTNNQNSLNSTRNNKSSIHNSSIVIDAKCDAIKTLNAKSATVTVAAQLRGAAPIASARDKLTTTIKVQANALNGTHTMMNGCKTAFNEHSIVNGSNKSSHIHSFNSNNKNNIHNNSNSNNNNNNYNNNKNNNNNNNNKSITEVKLMSPSESFRRRIGTNRLSPYNDPNFLKCEYDLARSQVINSRSKSASSEDKIRNNTVNNNNNNSSSSRNGSATNLATTLTASIKDLNRNKVTANEVSPIKSSAINGVKASELLNTHQSQTSDTNSNENKTMNVNCVQLDEIRFIDSDDSDRKQSADPKNVTEYFNDAPAISKLSKNMKNSSSMAASLLVRHRNDRSVAGKFDGLSNGHSNHHLENGVSRRTVHDEMQTSTSSTASSAKSDRSASPMPSRSITKEFSAIKLDNFDASSDNAKSSSFSTLPPTPSRFDRDSKLSSSISSRSSYDSDTFRKPSILDKSTDDDNTEGLCGLRNIGNTCFMNSIIQCLSHTKDLTRYLKTKVDMRSSTKDARIVVEFSKLIKEMWTSSQRSVTPSELKLAFSAKHRMYSGCSQQDAQEFLRFFLDALHCALNTGTKGEKLDIDDNSSNNIKADRTWEWYSKVENSVIKDLFVGQLKSSLKCTVCGNTSVTFDPFWDLSVPLPTSSRCKLESCLDLFIKEEILDGDEMPTCSKCKTRRKSTKTFIIQRFPKYLVIHLKRFSETRWSKLSNVVEFPTGERELNMSPYGANSPTVQYSLYGICNHMGSTAGGHYVAVCKHPVTHKWNEFNDNIVSPAYESSLVSSSAYVLFYERV